MSNIETASQKGLMRTCERCHYWSSLIAMVEGSIMLAYCFNKKSNVYHQYVSKNCKCELWKSDEFIGKCDE